MNNEEFLEHYGIPGMKWGVRKQKRLDRAKRVASGKASLHERGLYGLTDRKLLTFTKEQEKNNAIEKVKQLEDMKKKMQRGEAGAKEFLKYYGRPAYMIGRVAGAALVMSESDEEFLEHYGVRGMRWGVRRNLKKLAPSERGAYLKAKDAKWLAKVEANPKLAKVSRLTTKYAKKQTKALKKDYKEKGLDIKKSSVARMRYDNEVKVILDQSLERATYRTHKLSPSRLNEVQIQRHPDGTMTATVVARRNAKIEKQFKSINRADVRRVNSAAKIEKKKAAEANKALQQDALSHEDVEPTEEDFLGLQFFLSLDDEGFVEDILSPFGEDLEQDDMDKTDEFLSHYGVVGMKWGVRKLRNRSASKVAKKQTRDRFASEEGREAMRILTKQKKFGTGSLTNQELQVVNARIRLEQDFAKNFPPPKSTLQAGQDFAKKLVSYVDTAGSAVTAADKAKKILKGQYIMSEEAKAKAKIAAQQAAQAALNASP